MGVGRLFQAGALRSDMNERWEPWALWGESVLGRGSGRCKGPEAGGFQRQPEGRSD